MTASLREARIDLAAITRNVETIRVLVAPARVMVVVKADGYGHGAIPVATAAVRGGADWLGVVDLAEARVLRDAGITVPILCWLHEVDADFGSAIAAGIDIGVNYLDQLEAVAAASAGEPASVHLKVDTGLSRNGASEPEWQALFARAAELELAGRIRVRGVFSHLANTSPEDDADQVTRFTGALERARAAGLDPELAHLAASGGAISQPEARFDLVRIGISAYGLSPFADGDSAALGLSPAMELSAGIVSVKRVPAGAGVSYGYRYTTTAETTLALVPIGYADGVPRHASNTAPVSINGRTYRVCGTIAMDQFVVDVGDDEVAVGDRAILFGDPATGVPSAQDWAEAAGTINYEIVTRIGNRVARRYES